MAVTKDQIRRKILRKRESISVLEALERSASILKSVQKLPEYKSAKVVHTYVSSKPNEVDTRRLIDRCFKDGKRVIVPVINRKKKNLRHSEIWDLSELRYRTFGIYEPTQLHEVDIAEIGLVIVPAVALDSRGNRIGFGGGYYDRFLEEVSCAKIALAYDFQVLESITRTEHDIKVDSVITESRTIRCK